MKQVLMIEDDTTLVELVRIHLRELSCEVITTPSGLDGLAMIGRQPIDLCILDLMLPDLDGIEICRRIRQQYLHLPILMLTAKSQELDKVSGLEAGADDYLTKPFGIREFLARVKAILRRSELSPPEKMTEPIPVLFHYKDLLIDVDKKRVTIRDERVELTPKEFDLLVLLAQNPGKTYSRKALLSTVWGYKFEGYEHTVTAHVNRLRSKIEPDFAHPGYILTSWGVGYRFAEVETEIIHD
jgi:two-component system alkaline phosphatase synthesis response regulator PhoP